MIMDVDTITNLNVRLMLDNHIKMNDNADIRVEYTMLKR